MDFDDVTDLIHMLHYAETVRVIRANVGQMPEHGNPSVESDASEEEAEQLENEMEQKVDNPDENNSKSEE